MFGSTHLFRTLLTVAALMTAMPGFAFDTLDGNRARWRSMPVSYSINSHSPDVSLSDERAAIAAAREPHALPPGEGRGEGRGNAILPRAHPIPLTRDDSPHSTPLL